MKLKIRGMVMAIVVLLLYIGTLTGCSFLNDYQDTGELTLAELNAPVKVIRDEKGMAYIYAQDRDDVTIAYGFVTAQDRLFQMELTKLFASGRISELAGEKARSIDIRNRTIGFYRNAVRQAAVLNSKTRRYLQNYVDGVNAYIETRQDTHHLEFKLAGIKPQPWTIEDALCITFYMSWNSAANLKTEIIAQLLSEKIGLEKAREIFPLNINPDDPTGTQKDAYAGNTFFSPVNIAADRAMMALLEDNPLRIGSNNWAASSRMSMGGKPIVANDPHLDARLLPGPWYPCGLITPESRIVGASIPGVGSMITFRNDHIAVGITNAYGDAQDLYVETLDPNDSGRYLEGDQSLPFDIIEETLTIKDKDAPDGLRKETIRIRLTRRGPVVSDIWPELKIDRVISLRWAPFETMQSDIGISRLQYATSVKGIRKALRRVNLAMFNFVFADTDGNIGWQVSGRLPVRKQGEGTVPYRVKDGVDNWIGWIPFSDMPHAINPKKGWVGTCNHYTVGHDYPYYYTSHASSSYRYRRLTQLMESPGKKSAADHWAYQQDTLNLMAEKIAPLMAAALTAHPETEAMGKILSQWDFHDHPDQSAPAIFQNVYRHFARQTFLDELGEATMQTMLGNWYFWQERLQKMVLENRSEWFDDTTTGNIRETRDDLFYRAALEAGKELKSTVGGGPEKWKWGKVHTIAYVSPIRREGFGKGLLGGGEHPAGGSAETLLRNYYDFNKPFSVKVSDSLRMVADLSDPEKIMAVLPGGVTGRVFHPHYKDQVESFMNGSKRYWWFSDEAIMEHKRASLLLNP